MLNRRLFLWLVFSTLMLLRQMRRPLANDADFSLSDASGQARAKSAAGPVDPAALATASVRVDRLAVRHILPPASRHHCLTPFVEAG
jgi:hypothetical protein